MEEHKFCHRCKTSKPRNAFYKCKARKDGLQTQCIACKKEVLAAWYQNRTPEQVEAKRVKERGWYSRQSSEQLEKKRASYRDRYASDPATRERIKLGNSNRRTMLLNAKGFHTNEEWIELVLIYNHKCGYCDTLTYELTRDHRVPLTRGGTNYIENITPACGRCNKSKNNRTVKEFIYG